MKKIVLVLIAIIIVGILIPAVSAEEQILEDEGSNSITYSLAYHKTYVNIQNTINVYRIQDWYGLYFVYVKVDSANMLSADKSIATANPYYSAPVTFKIGSNEVGSGTAYYNSLFNSAGTLTGVQFWVEIDNINLVGQTGYKSIIIVPETGSLFNGIRTYGDEDYNVNTARPIGFISNGGDELTHGTHMARSHYYWKNTVDNDGEKIYITRNFDENSYPSTFTVTSDMGTLSDFSYADSNFPYIGVGNWTVLNPFGKQFSGITTSDEPVNNNIVTVYVRNSQTGAAIANSHILINASVNDEFFEVINQTLPSGMYQGTLQPTGGGLPNPDFYRLIATAEGYNSIMPYIDFEVDGATTIYVYMDPIAGGPIDENKTFIDFFVRDLSANPISGATVNFGGYTLLTNSQGYTVFEIPKNATYSWTVSKSGYGPLTGNAAIGANSRYTVNTVLGPIVTPTTPTLIPAATPIGPTPTLTAPTGEPVSNLLEWFAAHFGMVLGGGVEIGKLFMWLCFTVPVGVYVGKEAKAGAAGFMAGAGIVTLFFVLIGWVPIWLVVLLVLIIGLLYAKVFNNSDNGGGR